jgi:N-acetylglucosaminyldiphosphoundecaprenol N-acetyl-beta-D-mannosaminyltransferase
MIQKKILGIKISDTSIDLFTSKIISELSILKNLCVSATGAHGIISSLNDKEVYDTLNAFDYNLPDGMPSVWLAKAKGAQNIKRCFGPFVFSEIMKSTAYLNINHYFCGGKEGVAEKLSETCSVKFNNNNIVGTFCPPFRKISEKELILLSKDINNKKTDIVWIGISTPKQEIFAKRLSRYTKVKILFTVGAAFDYYTGTIKIAPTWIQNAGLEWFYRLILEPRRLWKRYIYIVPKFIYYGFIDLLGYFNHPYERK